MDSRKLRYSLVMLMALIAFGTIGYFIFERVSFFDAFYMTIITISTVGFSEIVPLTKVGRSITVVDFLDVATMGNHIGLIMEEAVVGLSSGLVGKNLIETFFCFPSELEFCNAIAASDWRGLHNETGKNHYRVAGMAGVAGPRHPGGQG